MTVPAIQCQAIRRSEVESPPRRSRGVTLMALLGCVMLIAATGHGAWTHQRFSETVPVPARVVDVDSSTRDTKYGQTTGHVATLEYVIDRKRFRVRDTRSVSGYPMGEVWTVHVHPTRPRDFMHDQPFDRHWPTALLVTFALPCAGLAAWLARRHRVAVARFEAIASGRADGRIWSAEVTRVTDAAAEIAARLGLGSMTTGRRSGAGSAWVVEAVDNGSEGAAARTVQGRIVSREAPVRVGDRVEICPDGNGGSFMLL